jgi:hypothetical protein
MVERAMLDKRWMNPISARTSSPHIVMALGFPVLNRGKRCLCSESALFI